MEHDIKVGNTLIAQGQLDQADAHFRALAANYPEHTAPLQRLIHIAKLQSNSTELRVLLDRLLALTPESLPERALRALHRAWVNIEAGRYEIPALLDLAHRQKLTPAAAIPLMRVIQYAATERHRLAQLSQIKSLLLDAAEHSENPGVQIQLLLAELSLALGDFGDVIAAADHLKTVTAPPPSVGRIKALSRVAAKISAPEFPDFKAEKVFGIGLSRTGTTSLNAALKGLGYNAIHWFNPITRDLIHQDDFVLFDAFSDICVSHQFEWLYYTFPNSKFVLTTRAVESWTPSIERHYQKMHGFSAPSGLNEPSAKRRFRNRGGQMEANLYAHHQTWPEAHASFHDRVGAFFKTKPADRFLEMDIIAGDGWDILCPFLGRPIPETIFPNLNTSLQKKPKP